MEKNIWSIKLAGMRDGSKFSVSYRKRVPAVSIAHEATLNTMQGEASPATIWSHRLATQHVTHVSSSNYISLCTLVWPCNRKDKHELRPDTVADICHVSVADAWILLLQKHMNVFRPMNAIPMPKNG